MLKIENLNFSYDLQNTLDDISFCIEEGESLAILGANGAGKTTLLRCLVGLNHPKTGKILFLGQNIVGTPPHEISRLGVALVPERRHLFPRHTVAENLELGAFNKLRLGLTSEYETELNIVFNIFPILKDRINELAGKLSGGEQQMVAIARALIRRPRLLFLDEPSLGLSPILSIELFRTLAKLKEMGMTIVIAEQTTSSALHLCSDGIVLQRGRIVLAGKSSEIIQARKIEKIYFG